MKNKKGFSIFEVLVVVSIISILATIGFSTYASMQKKARDARRTSDLELIRASLEQFRSNNNDYPSSLPYPSGNGLCDPSGCGAGIYIQTLPVDPNLAQRYWYQRVSSSDYSICAYLDKPDTSSLGNCAVSGSLVCNYCLGPYGKK